MSDPTIPVRHGESFDLNLLQDWLRTHAPEAGTIRDVTQFPGGYSNLTYLLHTDTGDFVLRRPPVGANIKSAHDMGREFRVLSLLEACYDKIPKPVGLCEDTTVIGAPFYIMRRLAGSILRPGSAAAKEQSASQWRQLSTALVHNLADIHAINLEKNGLMQLGKPEGYVQRQVEGWIKRYYAAETDSIDSMNMLADYLPKALPPEQQPCLLHNDYKYDNVIFDLESQQLTGVLDWEMSTVGDPLMDLGAALAWWIEAGDGKDMYPYNVSWMPGNLTRREVAAAYAARSGCPMDHIVFYYAFGLFKNAVIGQQIYARWKQGLTQDARFGQLLPMIKGLSAKAQQALDTDGL